MSTRLQLLHTEVGFDLLVDPGDYLSLLLIRDGIFEAPETDLVTRIVRTGDTCIDAGCHLGYYSCLSARLVGEEGRVYSFDANPHACDSTRRNLALNGLYSTEVIQSALADRNGTTQFHISADDQTGLSSLGAIPLCKETIPVPSLRLETFLDSRHVGRARLLKIDVEGAEEMVLRGLGHFLADHAIDFILVECFDERLRLLNTSAESVAGILKSAGYTPWEYATQNSVGWSKVREVRSRGDCNYLFASPELTEKVPSISLSSALGRAQGERDRLQDQTDRLQDQMDDIQHQRDELLSKNASLRKDVQKLQDDADWLLASIRSHEEQLAELIAAKQDIETLWIQVQNSSSWRILNKWRRVRNRLVPDDTWRRRLYDGILGRVTGRE